MKICPECGTEYEAHVPSCLLDGTDLSQVVNQAAPPVHAVAAAPAPSSVAVTQAGSPPEPKKKDSKVLPLMMGIVMLLLFLIVGVMGLGAGAVFFSGSEEEKPAPKPAVAVPVAKPVAVPVAKPVVPVVITKIQLTSVPSGADVFEGSKKLCTTPCSVDHPEHAPLPRTFVLKHGEHPDTTYEVSDPDTAHEIALKATARRPASPRPRRVKTPPAKPSGPKLNLNR